MSNLLKNGQNQTMAGWKKMELIDKDDITAFDLSSFNEVTITSTVPFSSIDAKKILLSYPYNEDDKKYDVSVQCDVVGTANQYDSKLNQMTNHKYIVRLIDNAGIKWIIGTDDEPLNFAYVHIGDANAAGEHKYTLTFSRKMSLPAKNQA